MMTHCKYIHNSPVSSFVMTSVTEYQVQCLFNGLDGSKTSISVPNTLIRMASSILSPLFTTIYNESINTGVVLDILKISRITPMDKSGNSADPNHVSTHIKIIPLCKGIRKISL